MLHLVSLILSLYRAISRIGRSGYYLLLGIGIAMLLLISPVHASETVLLQARNLRMPIALAELQAFAAGQDISPQLRQFLQDAKQEPDQLRQELTAKITPPQHTGLAPDFALIQINKIIGDPLGREDLDSLRVAFGKALKTDQTFSVLELLENYPKSEMRLEVSRLGRVYADVQLLVTRIEPVLNIAKQLLPELICACSLASPAESSDSAQAIQTRSAVKALLSEGNQAEGNQAEVVQASVSEQPAKQSVNSTLIALEPSDSPALAQKNLVFQFGPLGRSISMQALTRFAETGELTRGWKFFFKLAGVAPENVQAALNQEISVQSFSLEKTLNTLLGEFLLYEVGQVVHTKSNTANIQALRSTSVLSARDGRLSLLELLQNYPTQYVYVNGARLARLGQNVARFKARGGVQGAILGIEDWLLEMQASASETVCECDKQQATNSLGAASSTVKPPTIEPDQVAQFLPVNWQAVAPHREDRGSIKVVWLQGSPYEMGYQHGQYLHDEIASMGREALGLLRFAGRGLALGRFAAKRSYPGIVEECQGLTDATQDIGMTLDACLTLAYGDVYQEIFSYTLPNFLFWEGCSQWVAAGAATRDGRLYHGSSVDNDKKPIEYIVNNPVVFVRQPTDGLPHIFITYPGVLWPNWGMNVAGITLGLDTAHPDGPHELMLTGGSNVQIMAQILKTATSFAEARQIMETQPRVRANLIMIADGKSKAAGVFEFTGKSMGVRELQDNGALYMTNHFVLAEMRDKQPPPNPSSLSRFDRFAQLMEPDANSYHGNIDPAIMAQIGRDRTNPYTLAASSFDLFDDDASPGGNGSLRQGIYDPERLRFWVAAGRPPVPENPFVCFSLGEMLQFPNATPCESPDL
jgi:hypothetical protein